MLLWCRTFILSCTQIVSTNHCTIHLFQRAGHAKIDFTVLRNNNAQVRMWATDLSVGPSLALASFQLFDFLSAGDFAPRSGVYAVHNGSSTASSTGDIGPDSLNNEAVMNSHIHVAERCYVSCEMVAIQDTNVGFEGILQVCVPHQSSQVIPCNA